MSLYKIIVVVGPELTAAQSNEHSRPKDRKDVNEFREACWSYCEFPEQGLGPRQVRRFMHDKVKSLKEREEGWVFFVSSRYGYALNELAQMVADKELDPKDVDITLYTEDGASKHSIDVFGFMSGNWPYGILS